MGYERTTYVHLKWLSYLERQPISDGIKNSRRPLNSWAMIN